MLRAALICLASLSALAAMESHAKAAIITEYTTTPSTTSPTILAGTQATGVTADLLAAGSGLDANSGSTWNWRGWDDDNTSFADAVADNDVWTWGFDVTGPISIEPTTLAIRVDRSGSGPDDFTIQASVNGGTGINLFTYDFEDSGSGVTFPAIDISGLGTLSQGDDVVFTLGAYNSESSGGTFDLETVTFPGGTDSIQVNGTITVVPEPSSVLAVAASGLTMVFRRRRR